MFTWQFLRRKGDLYSGRNREDKEIKPYLHVNLQKQSELYHFARKLQERTHNRKAGGIPNRWKI